MDKPKVKSTSDIDIRSVLNSPNLSISQQLDIMEKYMEDNNYFRDLNLETVNKPKNIS